MKYLVFLFILLCASGSTFAQSPWQKHTKIADSLEAIFQYEKALSYRDKALENIDDNASETKIFLEVLRDILKYKITVDNGSNDTNTYDILKQKTNRLEDSTQDYQHLSAVYGQLYSLAKNNLKNIVDSNRYASKSLHYYRKLKSIDSLLLFKKLQNSAIASRDVGHLDIAIKHFNDAEDLYLKLDTNDNDLLAKHYLQYAQIFGSRFLGNSTKYISYLRKAESLLETSTATDSNFLINFYVSLSSFETGQGNFNNAIGYLKKAFQLYENTSDKYNKRDITREIELHAFFIEVYWLKSNEDMMHYHFDKIKKLSKGRALNETEKDLVSLSYLFVAKFYRYENSDKALSLLDNGLQYFPEEDYGFLKEDYLMERAKILIGREEYNKANSILSNLVDNPKLPSFIRKNCIELYVLLHLKLNNEDKAYAYINKALALFSEENKSLDITSSTIKNFVPSPKIRDTNHLLYFANGLQQAKNTDDAIIEKMYWLALYQFRANYDLELLNDKLNGLYSKICKYFYSKSSRGELNFEKTKEFLQFTETVESKYLLNTFINNRRDLEQTSVDSIIDEEQFIRSNLTYLKRRNANNKSDTINQLIFEEELKLKKLDDQLKNSRNKIVNLRRNKNLFEILKEKTILKYTLVDSTLFRLLFNSNTIDITEIENYDTLNDSINLTVNRLKDLNTSPSLIKENLKSLNNRLLYGIDMSSLSSSIYIIPDGILHYLPFELLVSDDKYLLELKDISYANSLSLTEHTFTNKVDEPNVALFAPSYKQFAPNDLQLAVRGEPYYLEGTLKEVKLISKIFDKSELFINTEATKAKFINASKDYSILHLSMHSFINDEDSELSSLVFSDNYKDYELSISELYGLNLGADMAVLSACNTGVGKLETGKGLVSMNTAFTAAGVPSVLSSLWSAPDEATQKVITSFYEHLKNGETKHVALKNAKLDYLSSTEDPNLKHPYYWAGFILTGDTSAIIEQQYFNWWYIVLIVGSVLLIGFFIKKRLKTN